MEPLEVGLSLILIHLKNKVRQGRYISLFKKFLLCSVAQIVHWKAL